MIQMRLRRWGSDDWTYITLSGELETEVLSIVGGRASETYHLQLLEDGEWGDLDA